MVLQQRRHHLGGGRARPQPPAGLVQQGPEPVALGVGPLLQPAQVDLQGLAGPEQPLQRPPAERGVAVAVDGGRSSWAVRRLWASRARSTTGSPADRGTPLGSPDPSGEGARSAASPGQGQERLGHRGGDPVQGGQGGVDHVGPAARWRWRASARSAAEA